MLPRTDDKLDDPCQCLSTIACIHRDVEIISLRLQSFIDSPLWYWRTLMLQMYTVMLQGHGLLLLVTSSISSLNLSISSSKRDLHVEDVRDIIKLLCCLIICYIIPCYVFFISDFHIVCNLDNNSNWICSRSLFYIFEYQTMKCTFFMHITDAFTNNVLYEQWLIIIFTLLFLLHCSYHCDLMMWKMKLCHGGVYDLFWCPKISYIYHWQCHYKI